jgi:serine phosphatase RsbU (regulator of sigma subunit)
VPLGLFASARFGVDTYHLGAGDRLLLYTDGVSEAVNERGEEYGLSPLCALMCRSRGLSASEHTRAALEEVERFRGSAPVGDDLTLAALRRTAA